MKSLRFVKLALAAALFVIALTSSRTAFAACSYACEQICAARFDNCVAASGGWTENCQRLYDNCAFRCGC
jgi:hypothetical protein